MYAILAGILIGLTLGLFGSGGSILTVPALVYLLGHNDKAAIAESLGIVGAIALIGVFPYALAREVDWRKVLFFGLPGMAGTYGGAWLSQFVTGAGQLTLFACIMLAAAWMMYRRTTAPPAATPPAETPTLLMHLSIILQGLAVGLLTGMIGVGGGFLIVPALVVLGKLPLRRAVATSLPVIALQAFSGFFKYLTVLGAQHVSVDWATIGLFILPGAAGSLVGNRLGAYLNQRSLQRGFAIFLVGMGTFVLAKEAPRAFAVTTKAAKTADSQPLAVKGQAGDQGMQAAEPRP